MTAARVARRVVVAGRVQGVFFRDSCRQVAVRHGVTGWVRNRDDGTVEAVLEGAPDAVDSVVAWCRRGPSSAEVTGVAVHEVRPEGARSFTVG